MAKQVYWLSDAEWRRVEPLLPRGRKGAHRVDDRRVISGIVHMLKSGSRWRDCPKSAPTRRSTTAAAAGVGRGSGRIFSYALTGSTSMYGSMSVDSSYIEAHRSAAGAKGDLQHSPGQHPRSGRCTGFDRHGRQPTPSAGRSSYDARSLRRTGRPPHQGCDPAKSDPQASASLTKVATSSSGCSAASRTCAASQPETTSAQISSCPLSFWPLRHLVDQLSPNP